jgi:hypothetical protein
MREKGCSLRQALTQLCQCPRGGLKCPEQACVQQHMEGAQQLMNHVVSTCL